MNSISSSHDQCATRCNRQIFCPFFHGLHLCLSFSFRDMAQDLFSCFRCQLDIFHDFMISLTQNHTPLSGLPAVSLFLSEGQTARCSATQNVFKYTQTHREIEALADTSYCFDVYALAIVNNTLLTSSCTLHSRKFLR